VGIACGEEKGSFVAAYAEVEIVAGAIRVRKVCQTFECGKIINPDNLMSQVKGAIIQGLGPALREAMDFADGKIRNPTFYEYKVPRLKDVPEVEVHLIDRPDIAPAGAGEIPLIAVAPAIANAVFHATGVRLRDMPLQLPSQG
jgi:isoquinoline 1-oxidoreductase